MKKMLLAAAVIAFTVFTGCNSAAGGDPKTVLVAFFDALGKKDFTAAKKLATKDSESMFSMLEMGMSMNKDSKNSEMDKFDKSKMEFGETKIDGDRATVAVKDKNSGESTNFVLKKESGDWKVAFDKATMMQMGMEKMKEHGMDSKDVMDTVNTNLKNMNLDSLGDKMKEMGDKVKEFQKNNPDAAKKMEDAIKQLQEAQKQNH